jgi:hypothetical protein
VGIVLGLGSLLCALLFLDVAVTKMLSGYVFAYVLMAAFGLGAIGCFAAARQSPSRDPQSSIETPNSH